MDGGWTQAALQELVRGRVIVLRNDRARALAVPAWLLRHSAGVDDRTTDQVMLHVHPDDRVILVETFLAAAARPGEVVEASVRFERDGVWGHRHLRWLNLLEDPVLGGMLVASQFVEEVPVDAEALDESLPYDSAGTRWMTFHCNYSDASVARVEGRVEELIGYTPDELVGRYLIDFLHPDGATHALATWVRMWTDPQATQATVRRWRHRDGSDVWLESWYLRRSEQPDEVMVVVLDITERRQREAALRTSQEEFRLLADEAPAAVYRCDAAGTLLFRNRRWAEVVGDEHATCLADAVDPASRERIDAAVAALVADPTAERIALEAHGADGRRTLSLTMRAVTSVDGPCTLVGSIVDVSATVELRHKAEQDSLTGLLNRASIEARVAEALAADPTGCLLVFVDLDGFKAVNDDHGHEAGDVALRELAGRLRAVVRAVDDVGRYGGDEFVVLCRGVGPGAEAGIVDAIRHTFDQRVDLGHAHWNPDGSIGAARGEPDDDVTSFIRRADLAMFAVKHERHLRRARPVAVGADGARRVERYDIDDRCSRLTTLLAEHPSAEVSAVDHLGVTLPWPASIPLRAGHVLDDRSPLDAVIEQDQAAVVRAFQHASRSGIGEAQVRLTRDPGTWVAVEVIDVRERHGVIVRVLLQAAAAPSVAAAPEPTPTRREHARMGHIREDTNGFILDCDDGYASMMGVAQDELIGRQALDLVHLGDQEVAINVWLEMLADGRTRRGRWRTVRPDGTIFWTEVNLAMTDAAEVRVDVYDVSEEVQARHTARAQELRLERIAATVPVGLFETDFAGSVLYTNERACALLGVGAPAHVDELLAHVVSDHRTRILAALRAMAGADAAAAVDVEVEVRAADGDLRQCEMSVRPMKDAVEHVTGAIVCITDVTERARARLELERELIEHAFHDALTALPNRTLLFNRLEEAVARARTSGDLVAVVTVDVDGFAAVNERFGHGVGDEVLRRISDRLRRVARTGDTVARVEGDQFIVLLDGFFDPDLPRYTAEHIAGVLSQPFDVDGRTVELSAGIGIATSATSRDAGDLLRHADVAMRRSKDAGTGRPEVFDPDTHDRLPARNQLVTSLRQAVAAGDFLVLYQPIQDLASDTVTNCEALVRWRHPVRGMISPADFIPLAEDSGLIVPIGQWVLEQACAEACRWIERYGDAAPGISVNLSARQLREPDFVEDVDRILRATGLPPDALTLEITETAIVEDLDLAVAVLEQLRALGVQLAIDDFGTGYNSIAYLQAFPVDVLKVDKVFVDRLRGDDGDDALIAGILGLAGHLGVRTVAEGIETADQLDVLRRLGCAEGQGFYFSRPVDRDAIGEYLSANTRLLWQASTPVPAGSEATAR